MIAVGTYMGVINSYGLSETKKGKPQFAVEFKLTEEGPYKGQIYTWYGNLDADHPAAIEVTVKTLRDMGMKGNDVTREDLLDTTKSFRLKIEHNDYNGKVTPKIAWVNDASKAGFKKVELSSAMGDILKRQFAEASERLALKGGAPVSGEASSDDGDSVPF